MKSFKTILNSVLVRYIVFAFSLLIGLRSNAQQADQFGVNVKLDSTVYLIGDHPRLTVEADIPLGAELIWPNLTNPGQGLEFIEAGQIDSSIENNMLSLHQQFEYIHFDSGNYVFPSLEFQWLTGADTVMTTTPPIQYEVRSMVIDSTADLRPIKQPLQVQIKKFPLWAILLIALIVLSVVIYFIWRYIRKKGRQSVEKSVRSIPSLPPFEHAMQRLLTLREDKLWQHDQIVPYYSELTDILREYIELRFNQPALEETTSQIIDELKLTGSVDDLQKLEDLLKRADLVKFAKSNPVASEHERSMEVAVEFLTETKPANEPVQKPPVD